MPFPTTGVLDTFTRADDPSSAGTNWTVINQSLGIISNTLYNPVGSGFSIGYWNPATYGPDSECYFTIPTLPGSGQEVSAWLRMTNTSLAVFTCYGFTWTGGTQNLRIRKFVSGSATDLNNATVAVAAGEKLGVECIGTTLTAYLFSGGSWSSVLTTTDTSISAAGALGVTIQNGIARLDDFAGGQVVAAVPFVPGRMAQAVYRM